MTNDSDFVAQIRRTALTSWEHDPDFSAGPVFVGFSGPERKKAFFFFPRDTSPPHACVTELCSNETSVHFSVFFLWKNTFY